MRLVDFDFLLNKDKVEEDDDIEQLLTKVTRFDDMAKGEASLRQLKRGDLLQVTRQLVIRQLIRQVIRQLKRGDLLQVTACHG